MNWRAAGCGTLAAAVFVVLGLVAINRATAPAECPERLPYQPAAYEPIGSPTGEPRLPDAGDDLVAAGTAGFGLASWPVWVARDELPTASEEPLPPRIVLGCGDGTFQAYERSGS